MKSGLLHRARIKQTFHILVVSTVLWCAPSAVAGSAADRSPLPARIPPDVEIQIRNLHNQSPRKKIAAIRSLGEMGPSAGAAAPYLIELLDSREKYISFLERIYNFIAVLDTPGASISQETKISLIKIGAPAVDPLIVALTHPRAKVRGNAALVLGTIRNERAIAPLIAALKDSDPEVRMWAAVALGEMPNKHSVEPLISRLEDADNDVRSYAAYSLGIIGDRRSVEPLISSLRNGNDAAGPALHEITGESFGSDAAKWQDWWNSKKSGRARPADLPR